MYTQTFKILKQIKRRKKLKRITNRLKKYSGLRLLKNFLIKYKKGK